VVGALPFIAALADVPGEVGAEVGHSFTLSTTLLDRLSSQGSAGLSGEGVNLAAIVAEQLPAVVELVGHAAEQVADVGVRHRLSP
jgi:hypothetical protein